MAGSSRVCFWRPHVPSPPASVGFQMPLLGCITFKMPHWHQDATHRSAGSIFPAAFHTREQTDAHRGTLRGLHITPPSPASALCGWEGVNPDSLSLSLSLHRAARWGIHSAPRLAQPRRPGCPGAQPPPDLDGPPGTAHCRCCTPRAAQPVCGGATGGHGRRRAAAMARGHGVEPDWVLPTTSVQTRLVDPQPGLPNILT